MGLASNAVHRSSRSPVAIGLSLVVLLSLAGCGEPTPEPVIPSGATSAETTAAPPATPAGTAVAAPPTASPAAAPTSTASSAAAASPEPAEEIELTVHVRDLKKDKDKWVYEPDSRRQTAHYNIYEFDPSEMTTALGPKGAPEELVLKVRVTARSQKTSKGDPNGAQPLGGFIYDTRTCKILQVVSRK